MEGKRIVFDPLQDTATHIEPCKRNGWRHELIMMMTMTTTTTMMMVLPDIYSDRINFHSESG